jgi:hypothetical protein
MSRAPVCPLRRRMIEDMTVHHGTSRGSCTVFPPQCLTAKALGESLGSWAAWPAKGYRLPDVTVMNSATSSAAFAGQRCNPTSRLISDQSSHSRVPSQSNAKRSIISSLIWLTLTASVSSNAAASAFRASSGCWHARRRRQSAVNRRSIASCSRASAGVMARFLISLLPSALRASSAMVLPSFSKRFLIPLFLS